MIVVPPAAPMSPSCLVMGASLPAVVVPASYMGSWSSIPDPAAFGVIRSKAGMKSLLSLPVLAATTSTDAASFLKALPWPFDLSSFEHRGKPLVRFSRPDSGGVPMSSPFMKVSSWLLVVLDFQLWDIVLVQAVSLG